jgi:hypothetical protein
VGQLGELADAKRDSGDERDEQEQTDDAEHDVQGYCSSTHSGFPNVRRNFKCAL